MKELFRIFFVSLRAIYKADSKRVASCIFNTTLEIMQSFVFGVLFFKFFVEALFEKLDFTEAVLLICIRLLWQAFYSFYNEWYSNIYTEGSNARIQESLYTVLFEKTVAMDMKTLDNPAYYDTFRMVLQNSVEAMLSIMNSVFSYIKNIILLILNGCLLFTYEPLLFPFIILSVICFYFLNIIRNKYRIEKNRAINPLFRKYEYARRIFCWTDYACDIKTTGIYDVLIKMADQTNGDIEETEEKHNSKLFKVAAISNVSSVLLSQIPNILICSKALILHAFTSSEVAVAISSMSNVKSTLNSFVNLYPQIQEKCAYVRDYIHYLKRETEIKANEEGEIPEIKANEIEIKNVSFSYDGEKEILHDINMKISGGEKIAIVGRNGVGKTTLVKLLLQLYRPQSGEIEMDGKSVESYSLKEYRGRFGVAFQNTHLYSVLAAENVLMKPYEETETERERVTEALKKGRLYDRIAEEEKGIETTVTKEFDADGLEFSGGQAQKLALSRVFARDCGIIILDEPSASLDPVSEAEMYESMLELMKEKTVILISHRLSACRKVDRIYVLEDGKIAEEGTHAALLKKGGIYADMWHLQADGYIGAEA